MKRQYHVWIYSPGVKPYILRSFDKYNPAVDEAQKRYEMAPNDTQVEITAQGAIVWGPYIKGGRYKP